MRTFLKVLRPALLAGLLFLSSFALWSGEHLWMFRCSLVATEWGLRFLPLCLALAFIQADRLSLGLGLAAALLFSSASLRSLPQRRALPRQFLEAFGRPLREPPPPLADASIREQDLEFDPHARLALSFFGATHGPALPCLIVVHGGGWDGGDRGDCPDLSRWLALRGIAVASIDYRLAPAAHWPAQRADLLQARAYLASHARVLRIDPARFAVLGRSAGAQIALATAYAHPRLFRAVVDLYGPADLDFAWDYGRRDDILDSPDLLRHYLGGSPRNFPGAYQSASARFLASKDSPPTLMIHGLQDRLVWYRQSQLLDEKLSQRGQSRHLLIALPWGVHAFDYVRGPAYALSALTIWNFLDLNCGPAGGAQDRPVVLPPRP